MPASSIDLFHMQDARNTFDTMRPAPICTDANQFMGQCQNIHISTNCYYGYHDPKIVENTHVATDFEMIEAPQSNGVASASPQSNARKRSADEVGYPLCKRLREDDSSMCSLVGTRSSPSHSASALNVNIPKVYVLYFTFRFIIIVN